MTESCEVGAWGGVTFLNVATSEEWGRENTYKLMPEMLGARARDMKQKARQPT